MSETKRLVNEGAEKHLGVEHRVLDHGYVTLRDYLGSDLTIVAAARHSFDKRCDPDDVAGNTRLISYLVKNAHSSPLEQCALVFELKLPLFIAAQLLRHRTSKANQQSARYSELCEDFYIPSLDRVQAQSKLNKQGSGELLSDKVRSDFREAVRRNSICSFNEYHLALEEGVSRELARILLPVNVYSKMVWQMDLSNLLKFIGLRSHPSAQKEIRDYSDTIALIVKDAFPITWAAREETELEQRK